MTLTYLVFFIIGFALFFPIPMFVRRFGKFMPADAGTALVRSFHIARFASPADEKRRILRRHLWFRLIRACIKWGLIGGILLLGLVYFQYSIFMFAFLWLSALMAGVDERFQILPDVLTIPMLILGFCASVAQIGIMSPNASAVGALLGYFLPTLTSAIMTPFKPRSLGGGDVKMLAAVGAWLGFIGLVVSIFASFIFFTIIVLSHKRKEGPYGIALFLGVLTFLILLTLPAFQNLFVVL